MHRKALMIWLFVFGWLIVLSLTASAENFDSADQAQRQVVMENLNRMPLSFTENQGQCGDKIRFRANAPGASFFFSPDEVIYQFTRRYQDEEDYLELGKWRIDDSRSPFEMRENSRLASKVEHFYVKAKFIGANPNPEIVGEGLKEYKCNYFIGNDPSKWRTDVPNYGAVVYKDIYPGIDLKYYGDGRAIKYDFIVSPGADLSQIQVQYEGVKSLQVNQAGELIVETELGTITEHAPLIFQIIDEVKSVLHGEYSLKAENTFGFKLTGTYNSAHPLIIDPTLTYSTYLGGNGWDTGYSIALDSDGNAYVTGITGSSDFPTTPGAFDETYNAGGYWGRDAFVTKLSPSGNSLIYSTYLGGSDDGDCGRGIAVDADGSAYVSGDTESSDFPTENPFDGTLSGVCDAFVTKLSPSGNSLIYSTYLGGGIVDYGNGIAVDNEGSAYVTGVTGSSDFPTVNPFDGTYNGDGDAFVTKFSPSGSSLIYSTYLGGSNTEFELGSCIAVNANGNAYVTGGTLSSDFPTENPFDPTYNGGELFGDAFVSKLSTSGSSLVYSTYLGGSWMDFGRGIAVDNGGNAYVTGITTSPDFPTANPFDGTLDDTLDAFVTKFSPSGNSLVYSTYLGGSDDDGVGGIAIDADGNAYVTGGTKSHNFPTANAFDGTYNGNRDAFVTKFSPSGNSLVYSTYLGGSLNDSCAHIAVDTYGNAYVTGNTRSSDFPTENPFDGTLGGIQDAFVTKFSDGENQPPTVEITSPPEYRIYIRDHPAEGLTISGTASDPDGTLDYVEVTGNNFTSITSDCHGQQEANWSVTVPWTLIEENEDGSLTISAQSYDNNGAASEVSSVVTYVDKMILEPRHSVVGDTLGIVLNPYDYGESTPYSWIGNYSSSCIINTENYVVGWSLGWPPPISLRWLWMGWDMMGKPPGFPEYMELQSGDGFTVAQDGWYDVKCYVNSGNGRFYGDTWTALFSGSFASNWGRVVVALDIAKWSGDVLRTVTNGERVYCDTTVGNVPGAFTEYLISFALGEIIEGLGYIIDGIQQIINLWDKTDESWIHWNLGYFALDQPVWLQAGRTYVPRFRLKYVEAGELSIGIAGSAYMRTAESITISQFEVSHNSAKSNEIIWPARLAESNRNVEHIQTSFPKGLLRVDDEGDGDFMTVVDAVQNASSGDTIEIYSGTYVENITLDKRLTLIGIAGELGGGSDVGKPVIDGSSGTGRVGGGALCVSVDSCDLSGLRITGGSHGILLSGASHCSISDNHIVQNNVGVCLDSGSISNAFSYNNVLDNHFGLQFFNSSSQNSFDTDTIQANWFGVLLADSSLNNEFSNCVIAHSNLGVISVSSPSNTFTGNEFWMNYNTMILSYSDANNIAGNSIVGIDKGVHLAESYDNTIENNDFVYAGISISNETIGSQTISGNTLNDKPVYHYSSTSGVTVPIDAGQVILENCTNFTIENLTISEVDNGIQLILSSDNTISQCEITECLNGIVLKSSNSNIISDNTLTDNSFHGIRMEESANNQILDNTLTNDGITLTGNSVSFWNTHTFSNNTTNGRPIYYYADQDSVTVPADAGQVILANCHYAEIKYLDISSVEYSIQLGYSSNNLISEDTLSQNLTGLVLSHSDSNTITGCDFDSNSSYGVYVHSGTENIFWNNSFTSNSVSAYEDTGVTGNLWNLGEVGNEWFDFEENPGYPSEYQIPGPGDGVDYYPFGAFVRGDANGDGVIELGDVVYLINYVFRGGPPPIPIEAGDANCDGIVELGDIVYLINYLYRGGPPPGC